MQTFRLQALRDSRDMAVNMLARARLAIRPPLYAPLRILAAVDRLTRRHGTRTRHCSR
jgi:hypothetical protein